MMPATFPEYQSPEIAARWGCFNCCHPLDDQTLQDQDYPQGRGRYSLQCPSCGMKTFFDLKTAQEAS